MATVPQAPAYALAADEKVAQVMIYTASSLYWGDVIVKSIIRVSTWLRTNTAPDRITLQNAKGILPLLGSNARPTSYPEINVAVSQIQAFHLVPPAKDPPDYDPTEPNRKMEPVNALLNAFIFRGHIRITTNGTLRKFLEVTREQYTPLYETEIANLANPAMGVMSVPFVLVRQETTAFTAR